MTESPNRGPAAIPAVAIGMLLVVAGVVLLAGQLLDVDLGDLGWPVILIAIGVALLLIGLVVARESGLVVGGSVLTVIGLILFVQDRTGLWSTWAYAWALIPAASGLGLALWGVRSADGRDVRNGFWGLMGGLAMFAVGFLFFEGFIGLSGDRLPLPEWVLPVFVIAVGLVFLGRALIERPDRETPAA